MRSIGGMFAKRADKHEEAGVGSDFRILVTVLRFYQVLEHATPNNSRVQSDACKRTRTDAYTARRTSAIIEIERGSGERHFPS